MLVEELAVFEKRQLLVVRGFDRQHVTAVCNKQVRASPFPPEGELIGKGTDSGSFVHNETRITRSDSNSRIVSYQMVSGGAPLTLQGFQEDGMRFADVQIVHEEENAIAPCERRDRDEKREQHNTCSDHVCKWEQLRK